MREIVTSRTFFAPAWANFRPRRELVIDAGAVPTSGAPAPRYPAGTWEIATNILVQGTMPQVRPEDFGARLSQTISELTGGRSSPSDFVISRGARVMTEVGPTVIQRIAALAGIASLSTLAGPVAAVALAPAAVATVTAGGQIPGYWISIRGVFTSPNGFATADLNRAIARAFANTTTFAGTIQAFQSRLPPQGDGSSLLARLSQPDACTGGADYTQVYARACTRVGPGSVMTPIAAPPSTANPTPTPRPAPTTPSTANPTPTRPAPTRPAPTRPAPQPVRVTPTAPQVLVPAAPATSPGMKWYWWVIGGVVAGSLGVAIWKRNDIAAWMRRKK